VTSLRPVLICVWCHLTLARATSAHVCGTSVVLGPWYSVRVLIQHSVIMFRATSMANTDIDAINNNKKHVQFLSCDRSTGSCICPCWQNITDTHKRHMHDPVLLSQNGNCTCLLTLSQLLFHLFPPYFMQLSNPSILHTVKHIMRKWLKKRRKHCLF